MHFRRWPAEGPPPHFADEEDYERRVERLLATGAVRDRGQLYWQARVSERYPTVEVRCCDVQLRVDEAVLLAGLIRALVVTALEDARHGVARPVPDAELVGAACWTAARNGLDGDLYDLHRGTRRRAEDMLCDLLDRADRALTASGDAAQVHALVDRTLREGNGAGRQRRAAAAGGWDALLDLITSDTVALGPGLSRT